MGPLKASYDVEAVVVEDQERKCVMRFLHQDLKGLS